MALTAWTPWKNSLELIEICINLQAAILCTVGDTTTSKIQKGPLLETLKLFLYFSGSCISWKKLLTV
jgi:hypothetical protein